MIRVFCWVLLEVKLARKLNLTRIVDRRTHLPERRCVAQVRRGIGKIGVVECVEELKMQLDPPLVSQRKLLEQAEINVPSPWSMEKSRTACSKRHRWLDVFGIRNGWRRHIPCTKDGVEGISCADELPSSGVCSSILGAQLRFQTRTPTRASDYTYSSGKPRGANEP